MNTASQTGTKVAASSVVVAVVVAAAGLGLIGMAAGLLPGIAQVGTPNLRASIKADKQSVQANGDFLTYIMTIANTGTVKTSEITALQHFAADTLSFVSAKTTGTPGGFSCSVETGASDISCSGGALKAGESASISLTMKLLKNANACGTSGSAMSLLTIDPKNVIAEQDETDNAAKLSIAVPGICPAVSMLPNLTVTNLAVASSNGLVTATLSNTGAADVTTPFNISLYVNGAKSMTYSTSTLADVSSMKTGGVSLLSTKTVDLATTTSVKICTDALEAIAESNETDNCQELTLGSASASVSGTTAGTDLTVKKTGSVPSVKQGDLASYTILVSNVGTVDAASVGLTDVYTDPFAYASATGDKGFVCASATKTVVCKGGMIGAGKTATITVKLTTGTTGLVCDTTKVVTDVATVDPLNKIVETNEDNNLSTADTILTNPCSGSSVTTTAGGGSVTTGGGTTATTTGGGSVPNR